MPKHTRLRSITSWSCRRVPTDAKVRLQVYCENHKILVYASEERDGSGQVDFAPIDMSVLHPSLARARQIQVEVWIKRAEEHWSLVNSCAVDLYCLLADDGKADLLLWVGQMPMHSATAQELDSMRSKFPSNLTDPKPVISASYEQLVRLWTLQQCLDDAQCASLRVAAKINSNYSSSLVSLEETRKQLEFNERKLLQLIESVKKDTELLEKQTDNVRRHMERESACLKASLAGIQLPSPPSDEKKSQLEVLENSLNARKGELATQLLEVFPIEPIPGKASYSICGLELPNMLSLTQLNPVEVGAAFGFVAQVIVVLSQYMDIPLSYPIQPYGSQSFIVDPIANIKGSRRFPLWTGGVLPYRVEYAVYLLHRDIAQLMAVYNIPVADPKQTLANIRNLLLVISS